MKNWVGKNGPFLIAEIGGNHEGDFEYAKNLTALACGSGVDAVKFQIYTGDTIVSKVEDPDRNKHFKKFELSKNEYISLAKMCQDEGVIFTSSVWDLQSLSWIDEFIPVYKVGSGDLTAYPILKEIAKTSKPLILSTGLSELEEVNKSIEFLRSSNEIYYDYNHLAILQCTSMYPIELGDSNLNVMKSYKDKFNVAVGYSDHTVGTKAVEIAYSLGAEIIEMHFTDQREGKEFRDHKVSFTCEEIEAFIERIKEIDLIKGDSIKKPLKIEEDSGHLQSFRRAVYPSKDLKAGTILTEENLTVLRPNKGIDARDFYKLIGKKIKKDIKESESLYWDIIE